MTLPAAPSFIVRLAACTMLAVEIAVHAYLAPPHLDEIPYIGAAFVAATVLLAITIAGIAFAPRSSAPWAFGVALCAAMGAAFIASRTVGLPGFQEAWTSDNGLGLVSLPPEVGFIALALRADLKSALIDSLAQVRRASVRLRTTGEGVGLLTGVSSGPSRSSLSPRVGAGRGTR